MIHIPVRAKHEHNHTDTVTGTQIIKYCQYQACIQVQVWSVTFSSSAAVFLHLLSGDNEAEVDSALEYLSQGINTFLCTKCHTACAPVWL